MYETESKYCPRIRSLLVSKIFTNFVGITSPVFSLPSADFVYAAVKIRQIRWRANYSCRRTNQRSFDNAFVYILCVSWIYTQMVASSIMWLLKRWLNSSDGEVFAIIFWASDGKLLKNIKSIKTAQINLREWQRWQQLLILYINIVTLWCYSWESRMYSTARETVTIAYTRMHACWHFV